MMMPYLEEASLYGQVDWTTPLGRARTTRDAARYVASHQVRIVHVSVGRTGRHRQRLVRCPRQLRGQRRHRHMWMNDTSPTQDCAYTSLNPGYSCSHAAYSGIPELGPNPEAAEFFLGSIRHFHDEQGPTHGGVHRTALPKRLRFAKSARYRAGYSRRAPLRRRLPLHARLSAELSRAARSKSLLRSSTPTMHRARTRRLGLAGDNGVTSPAVPTPTA